MKRFSNFSEGTHYNQDSVIRLGHLDYSEVEGPTKTKCLCRLCTDKVYEFTSPTELQSSVTEKENNGINVFEYLDQLNQEKFLKNLHNMFKFLRPK